MVKGAKHKPRKDWESSWIYDYSEDERYDAEKRRRGDRESDSHRLKKKKLVKEGDGWDPPKNGNEVEGNSCFYYPYSVVWNFYFSELFLDWGDWLAWLWLVADGFADKDINQMINDRRWQTTPLDIMENIVPQLAWSDSLNLCKYWSSTAMQRDIHRLLPNCPG